MEHLWPLLYVLLPSAAVMLGMYLTARSFLAKDFERKLVEFKTKSQETVLPLRLQAYERICLYLERISPNNLVPRANTGGMKVAELHSVILGMVREEFNHNLSQQVYMSDAVWQEVKKAMNEVIGLVNSAAEGIDREANGLELVRAIFDRMVQYPEDPTQPALRAAKSEVQKIF